MRLINTSSLRFETFFDELDLPAYAILSHRWIGQEVDYQDVLRLDATTPEIILKQLQPGDRAFKAWTKICRMCMLARQQDLEYAWIDTCCIDKSSSTELSEAINSMFRWYQNAAICYVYLADVSSTNDGRSEQASLKDFSTSKWFERGWTLQELLAPKHLFFYDKTWQRMGGWTNYGTRHADSQSYSDDILDQVVSRTNIPLEVLRREQPLSNVSVAAKMSWAAGRKTTRSEDEAYCLLGIFDVNMPMLYGEGSRAFIRLQEAIMRSTTDQSIFAWNGDAACLLAPSTAHFWNSATIAHVENRKAQGSFEVLKHGLRMDVDVVYCKYAASFERNARFVIREEDCMLLVQDSSKECDCPARVATHIWQPNLASARGLARASSTTADCHIEVRPVSRLAHAITVFAVLDCYRIDEPSVYPALILRVLSWKSKTFALQNHRLVYLRDVSSKHLWLESVGQLDRMPFRFLPLGMADSLVDEIQPALSRCIFPTVRQPQRVTILDDWTVRSTGADLALRLTVAQSTDHPLRADSLRLKNCWPSGSWDLENGIAFVAPSDAQRRFILQVVGPNGVGVYILLSFVYRDTRFDQKDNFPDLFSASEYEDGPSTWYNPVLYMAHCDPKLPRERAFQFLKQGENDRNRTPRLKDHIHIGPYNEELRHLVFRVDVRVRKAQIAHSRSGLELLVSVRRSVHRSPVFLLKLLAWSPLFWICEVFVICYLAVALAFVIIIWSLLLIFGTLYVLWRLSQYLYLEYRDRHRYRS